MTNTQKKDKGILELAGAWKDMDNKEIESIKGRISKLRKISTKELMSELYEEEKAIDKGDFLTEEEFEKKHNVNIGS